ncbi:carboxylic ester hydrolase [Elysia marginata]|uniref:Carboxylic ester hydrolase n=1 Tax=Elysia marginata TaxID=1093978 RepID=A0AAV4IV33_9GAST|nr:carboxylic ester hydrolase [Elysia marginata]
MSSFTFELSEGVPGCKRRSSHVSYLYQLFALFIISLLLLSSLSTALAETYPTVDTDRGKVRGISVDANGKRVHAFYGIPYAAPPVGDLRFKPPVQMDPWEGVRDATRLPNSCYQTFDYFFGNFSGSNMWNANTQLSEDCLYLNVWTPRTNPPYRNKAVIVWIYGGGFYSGSSTLDIYMANILTAENDVIVVSMQYRVGALGFLALESTDAMGNAGLWDQRMALEWVSRNIHYFGGDAHSVTLMGESAGAVSVGLFLVCDLCRGYFHRAILQSGAPQAEWGAVSKEEMWSRSNFLAKTMGCDGNERDPAATLRCMQLKNASDFPNNEILSAQGIIQFPFVPMIDGVFIRQDPKEMLRRGEFKKVPLLLGSNSNEGTFFIIYYGQYFKREQQSPIDYAGFQDVMRGSMFKYYPHFPYKLNEFGKEAILFQYRNWLKPFDKVELQRSVDKAVSDYYFVCKVNGLANAYARQGVNVWYYWFDHRWSANPWPKWMGVLHADEIWFTFGHPFNSSHIFTREERDLSRKMMTYWTNFAKSG